MEYVKNNKISLKHSTSHDEAWLQALISDDPALLGLGDLVVKDLERKQISGGRLDMLLADPEGDVRYEVEIQPTNPTSSAPWSTGTWSVG